MNTATVQAFDRVRAHKCETSSRIGLTDIGTVRLFKHHLAFRGDNKTTIRRGLITGLYHDPAQSEREGIWPYALYADVLPISVAAWNHYPSDAKYHPLCKNNLINTNDICTLPCNADYFPQNQQGFFVPFDYPAVILARFDAIFNSINRRTDWHLINSMPEGLVRMGWNFDVECHHMKQIAVAQDVPKSWGRQLNKPDDFDSIWPDGIDHDMIAHIEYIYDELTERHGKPPYSAQEFEAYHLRRQRFLHDAFPDYYARYSKAFRFKPQTSRPPPHR